MEEITANIYRWTAKEAQLIATRHLHGIPHVGDSITFSGFIEGSANWIVEHVEHMVGGHQVHCAHVSRTQHLCT